jgi:hypothetical protein
MPLGACLLKRYFFVLVAGLGVSLCLVACGGGPATKVPPAGNTRVLASQGVSSATNFGGLDLINGWLDLLIKIAPLSAGNEPGLMAISPGRSQVAAFDQASNNVYTYLTSTDTSEGSTQLTGLTYSMVIPTEAPFGYAAVPSAFVQGHDFIGAIEVMNLTGGLTDTIAVTNAQMVVSNPTGSQLLVFSNDSDVMTVLSPDNAFPPVDTSCLTGNTSVCILCPSPKCPATFSRPVNAIINGSVAYVLNCGAECGGVTASGAPAPASVTIFDLNTLTITNTIPVDAATMAFLSGTTLYVAGTSPSNNACTGETTAATTCGRLDVVNLTTNTVSNSFVVTDGYHHRMDMSSNGQLFIGSHDCTNIGDVNNPLPGEEIRGCLTILNTINNAIVIPPDNGDVNGFQSFSTRYVEYVAQGGNLRVYDATIDSLLINNYILNGTIPVVGYVGDVKAIDFF